jgi:hypothetical protein
MDMGRAMVVEVDHDPQAENTQGSRHPSKNLSGLGYFKPAKNLASKTGTN